LREDWEQLEQGHRELQERILAIPGSQRVLRKLPNAGADQGQILSLLSSAVADTSVWLKTVRSKKREL
jgi:hypothetical protein